MTCKIFLPEDWMYGDATAYYVDIIAEAMKRKGFVVEQIKSSECISQNDIVVTVASYNVSEVRKKHPLKIINWFQGIAAEESFLFSLSNKSLFLRFKAYLLHTLSDYRALKYCDFNFFVSDRMRLFYRHKHFYYRNNFYLMPCFNQKLNRAAFSEIKYSHPSFVYAGSMDGWQCFEKTVKLFMQIKNRIPNATFTVLTAAQDRAKEILTKYGVDAELKYVHYTKVDEELRKFKYGFIVRDNNIVNNVATPTKMNSYLANGIIPIFTNVVGAFKENIAKLNYAVPLTTNNEGIEKLFEIERDKFDSSSVYDEYSGVFATYYSKEKYIEEISNIEF